MELIVVAQNTLPADHLLQVRALHEQAWPELHDEPGSPLHDPALDPIVLLLLDGGRLVSSAEVLTVTVQHEGREHVVSGLSCVVTDEQRRGEGFATRPDSPVSVAT